MSKSDNARMVYNVPRWSEGYFDINDSGSVVANPTCEPLLQSIELSEIVNKCRGQGLSLPILIRFTDILLHRVDSLVNAFNFAKNSHDYTGKYTAVYPIKVNQQYSVVRKLLEHPSGKVGLEAGSKPELMAILGVSSSPLTIICNGYKDSEFLRAACIGRVLGHDVNIVIEKLSELRTLIEVAKSFDEFPDVGIRIRLNSVGKGKWQNTGGEKGKFGLTASQLLAAANLLEEAGHLDKLTLVHFHIGSQVANIHDIHSAINECARYYAELRALGLNIKTVDVGGGLGVDYEGSESRSACSINYTVNEYARNVVAGFADVCNELGLPHPDIITESGRALTAHHAVLITDVIDIEQAPKGDSLPTLDADAPAILERMLETYQSVNDRSALEAYHDIAHCFGDAYSLFVHGVLDIKRWANVEQLYFATLHKIKPLLNPSVRSHREVIDELNEKLADKLFLNFSLFQSLPDVWGIEQLFPILPLQRLDETLEQRVIIQDITCDSDGQIRMYSDGAGIESSLPIPQYRQSEEFLVGMFMIGAYQEILGDLHNLFGDTDSVHVEVTQDGGYELTNLLKGDTVSDVLRTVHFNPEQLLVSYQKQLNRLELTHDEKKLFLGELREGLNGYTYFED